MDPDLVVGFRIDKFEQEQGYELFRHMVKIILNKIDADMRFTTEGNEHVLLQRVSGRVSEFFPNFQVP